MHRNSDRELTADHLLQQAAALRGLGRRLLDDAAAEDLVQETYLAALRGRSPNGAIGAWLHGIAHKLARLMRRRTVRQQRREQVAARPAASPSAADAAASVELMQRIAAAVQALPEAYRIAVVLRFWHDLPPRRIALELQVSVHTVRSRLQRALAMLRERLDEGAGSRSGWMAPLGCLVQAPVASVGAAGVVATLFAGVTSMGTKLHLGAAALIVLAAGWGITRWWQGAATPLPPDAGAGAVLAAAPAAGEPPTAPERQVAAAEPTQVTGRCIAAENGAPLSGCRVVLLPARAPLERGETPQMVTTDPAGRFALPVHAEAGRAYRLMFGMAERVVDGRSFPALPSGQVEVGDIALSLGAMAYGTVHTANGQPVAEIGFECRLVSSLGVAPEPGGGDVKVLFARAGGVLQQDEFGFGPGRWRLTVNTKDHELVSPREFDVLPGQRRLELDVLVVALADLPAIGGVLVDEAGVPVGGVMVHAGSTANGAVSGADGTFVVHRRQGEDAPVRLSLGASAVCSLRDPEAVYAWGSEQQRVTVQRPAGLVLQVVNATTGAAVTEFGVRLQPLAPGDWQRLPRQIAEHADGLLQLREVKAGRYRIVAFPGDPELVPSEPVEVELGPAGALLQLACEPARWLTVAVQTASGEPVAGAYVDLVRREGEGELTEQSLVGTEDYVAQFGSPNRFVVLASGRSDARGELVLRGPSRGYLGLRARGAFVSRLLAPVVPGGSDQRIVMQVERGATLQGSLAPAALLTELRPSASSRRWVDGNEQLGAAKQQGPTLQLRASAPVRVLPKRTLREEPGFPIAADGTFRIEGIPPGDWTIELQYAIEGRPQERAIGKVAGLREGERREVEFSLADLVPGELRAAVLRDGAPWPNAEIYCNNGWSRTDARGQLTLRVAPGSYRLAAEIGEGHDRRLHSDQEVVVRAGEVTTATVDFVRRRVRIHVLDADGAPVRNRGFQIAGFSGMFETDAEGWLLLDPAPPWPCTLVYYEGWLDAATVAKMAKQDATVRSRLRRTAGPLPMPLDRLRADLELRLPR